MPLSPGTQLGPYQILDPLGAGGMGEVYRARDTRLDRTVAIKVLPGHLAERSDLRQRFDREARAVSSLSHPHICALYDVGSEGGIDFLVMEYLEGETLADRLARGRMPAAEVLKTGAQIAEALAAAHRSGVVHRDLKPGNIMLSKSGVKVLDFGLAKTAGAPPDPASEVSRTVQSPEKPLTAEGTILGTFQYMAPEQLEGKDADARSDIFALGTVLYEMATGRRAFEGHSQASLIASILKDEPRGMAELEPMTPPALERVVRACQAKNPDDRIQTAHDLAMQLAWIAEGGSQAGVPVPVVARRRMRNRILTVLVGAVALAVGLVAGTRVPRKTPVPPVARFSVIIPDDVTPDPETVNLSISPDGTIIAFRAADSLGVSSIWLRRLDSQEVKALPGTDNGALPFWSPDSRNLGFFADGKLKRIPAAGGAAQVVCDAPDGRGGAWSRDDVIVFAPTSAGILMQVPAGGGAPTPATSLDEAHADAACRFPVFLPDGRHFLYAQVGADSLETRLGELGSLESRLVLISDGSAVYAPPGYLLIARGNALLAQRFDPGKLELAGDPVALPDVPGGSRQYAGAFVLGASSTGTLVYHAQGSAESRLAWLDRSGRLIRTLASTPGGYLEPRISPDGTRAAVSLYPPGGNPDIWVFDLARGIPIRFTHGSGGAGGATWSPDGRTLYFYSINSGAQCFYRQAASGAGMPVLLLTCPNFFTNITSVSPDGGTAVYRSLDPKTGDDIWSFPLQGKGDPTPLIRTQFDEDDGALSPDGRWLAYRSNESGRHEIYVQSFPGLTEKYRVTTEGCTQSKGNPSAIAWTKGGKELVYLGSDGATVMAAPIETSPAFHAGVPRPLFKLPRGGYDFTVTADGERFLVCAPVDASSGAALSVVMNWTSALPHR